MSGLKDTLLQVIDTMDEKGLLSKEANKRYQELIQVAVKTSDIFAFARVALLLEDHVQQKTPRDPARFLSYVSGPLKATHLTAEEKAHYVGEAIDDYTGQTKPKNDITQAARNVISETLCGLGKSDAAQVVKEGSPAAASFVAGVASMRRQNHSIEFALPALDAKLEAAKFENVKLTGLIEVAGLEVSESKKLFSHHQDMAKLRKAGPASSHCTC